MLMLKMINKDLELLSKVYDLLTYFRFFNKFGFPGIIGVIDCTHIAIVPPNSEDNLYPEHVYVNRKGYHSINTQLVSNLFKFEFLIPS